MPSGRRLSPLLILFLSLSLFACGGGKKAGYTSGVICRDVVVMPQNLSSYASAAGGSRPLAPMAAQAESTARQRNAFYRPWRLEAPTRGLKDALGRNFNMKPERAFTARNQPFSMGVWQELVANSNKASYPALVARGITLRHTNLRAMPTALPFYLDPNKPGEGFPFDYFQQTSLPVGVPLLIAHISADQQWYLVESPLASGWLPIADVAVIDEDAMQRWQSRPLVALLRDNVALPDSRAHIGTLLPLAEHSPSAQGHSLTVYYPVRAFDGKAGMAEATLDAGTAALVPLPLTPFAVAAVGNEMMGQPYGWGGLAERRDCSALTRDLFTPFGLWLPRNSSRQANVGRPVSLAGLGNAEKEAKIMQEALPFASLIWMRGHIGVYLGPYQGKPVMYHNMWGLRTRVGGSGCDGRAVVGKAVVTSLRPGVERPDICSPGGLLERIERVSILPSYGGGAGGLPQ